MGSPMPPPRTETGSGLTSKMGPLPVWGWVAIAAAGTIVGIYWWRARKSAKNAAEEDGSVGLSSSPSSARTVLVGGGAAEGLPTEQYESLLALLRDIQGQNSTPIGDGGGDTPDPNQPVPSTPDNGPRAYPSFQLSVQAGELVETFNSQIKSRHDGKMHNWVTIEAANPSLAANINWVSDINSRTFKKSATYTIPAVTL